jgi:hypothetical protein
MKKYFQALALLLMGVVVCNSQPKIKIINPDIDFGEVKYSKETVETRIEVTNVGTDTLRITAIKPSCGCTVAEMINRNIAPGDTSYIIATLSLNNYSGKVSKHITVNSNDTSTINSKINLNVFVIRPFEIVPKYITFDKVIVGKTSTTEVLLKNNSNKDAVVKSVSFSKEGIICNLKADDVLKKGESFKLVSTAIATQTGSIRCKLKIELYHPDEKEVEAFVYGNAIEDVSKEK